MNYMDNNQLHSNAIPATTRKSMYPIIIISLLVVAAVAGAGYYIGKRNTDIESHKTPSSQIAQQAPLTTITPSTTSTLLQPTTPTTKSTPTLKKIPTDWNTSVVDIWGPGEGEVGKYWKLTISLPPNLEYINSGSEEFIQLKDDYSTSWNLFLQRATGSRREQYRNYLVSTGGYGEGNKPVNTCKIMEAKEIFIDSANSYLDATGNCESKNSDGSIYTRNYSAYLYQTQGMLLIIFKSSSDKNALLEQNIASILHSITINN